MREGLAAQASITTTLGAPGLAFETWEGCEPHHRLSSSRLNILARMTRGLHRYQQSGNFHFITFSCYGGVPIWAAHQPAISSSQPSNGSVSVIILSSSATSSCPNTCIFSSTNRKRAHSIAQSRHSSSRSPYEVDIVHSGNPAITTSTSGIPRRLGEAALHAQKPGEARSGFQAGRLGVVQFPALCDGIRRNSRD